jgi:hypothetical protein
VQEIREQGILQNFPGRTEADLYLWVMDHRYYLSQAQGHAVGAEEATASYRERFAKGPLGRFLEGVSRFFRRLSLQPGG